MMKGLEGDSKEQEVNGEFRELLAEEAPPKEDAIFLEIQDQIENGLLLNRDTQTEEGDRDTRISEQFTSLSYGLQPRAAYEHSKKSTDIMGVAYNGRMRHFVILDSKGITTWNKDAAGQQVVRAMTYAKYEYRVLTSFIYAKKHNVYFALGKDFSLKVLNRNFEETCHVSSDLRSILFMIFNPVRDELITGGVGGTKVWMYVQSAEKTWDEIKPMANYRLKLKYELPSVGGSWVKRVELDLDLQHLYCCSDTDLLAYDMDGNLLFKFERAHSMSITGCAFSKEAGVFVTSSVDTEVKVWSLAGGMLHTFRGHSRPVTNLLLHPDTSALVLTCSLDGTVCIWSLHTMAAVYSLTVSSEGVIWMGLTEDNLLFLGTLRTVTLWGINRSAIYWAHSRNRVRSVTLARGGDKSTRVMAVGEDNSVRIFSRGSRRHLSTVLPPPSVSPLQTIRGAVYNRSFNVVYLLINTKEIWVYTVRTDPACRVAVWDLMNIQQRLMQVEAEGGAAKRKSEPEPTKSGRSRARSQKRGHTYSHPATEHGSGYELVSECLSACSLESHVMTWTAQGMVCTLRHSFLLLGLEDGRILFMDPVVKAEKYLQLQAHKDAIEDVRHDAEYSCLLTRVRQADSLLIQVWSLPELTLTHVVHTPADITGFTRLDSCFITCHQSGSVLQQSLIPIQQTLHSAFRPRVVRAGDDCTESSGMDLMNADHPGPVIAIDSCRQLGIYCTASADGCIKVWQKDKVLLTEITLNDSLSTLCFLNRAGDIVLGLNNHIFHISAEQVCPSLKSAEDDLESLSESESVIIEDPAVKYEGVHEHKEILTLRRYLIPYNLDFSQDFLVGKTGDGPQEEVEEKEETETTSTEAAAAPTEIYMSPPPSPRRLSLLDLTLSSRPERHPRVRPRGDLAWARGDADTGAEDDISPEFSQFPPGDATRWAFEMPKFGISPGPSPSPSPPSSIATPSDFDVSDGGETTADEDLGTAATDNDAVFKPIAAATETPRVPDRKAAKPVAVRAEAPAKAGFQSRLSNVKIDSKNLMAADAATKVTAGTGERSSAPREVVGKADHSHVTLREQLEKPSRPVRVAKKKQFTKEKKRPPSRLKPPVTTRQATLKPSHTPVAKQQDKTIVVRPPPRHIEPEESGDEEPEDETGTSPKGMRATPTDPHRPRLLDEHATAGEVELTEEHLARMQSRASDSVIGAKSPDVDDWAGADGQSCDETGRQSSTRVVFDDSDTEDEAPSLPASALDLLRPFAGSPTTGLTFHPDFLETLSRCASRKSDIKDTVNVKPEVKPNIKPSEGKSDAELVSEWISDFLESVPENKAGLVTPDDHRALYSGNHGNESRLAYTSGSGFASHYGGRSFSARGPRPQGYPGTKSPLDRRACASASAGARADVSGGFRAIAERYGSPTPSVRSDQGSDWTVPAPDDLDLLARLEDIREDEQEMTSYQRNVMSAVVRKRTDSSYDGVAPAVRPHTTFSMPKKAEELEKLYDDTLHRYQTMHGTTPGGNKLYHNDGTQFEENWQERMRERYLLMRMQRRMRCQSACEKRQSLDDRRQKQAALKARHQAETPLIFPQARPNTAVSGMGSRDRPSGYTMRVDISSRASAPPPPSTPGPRGDSRHRPPGQRSRPVTALGSSPSDGRGHVVARSESRKSLGSAVTRERDLPELCPATPYRGRLGRARPATVVAPPSEKSCTERVDIRRLDPRRSRSASNLVPTKSIPSKCTRYILLREAQDAPHPIIPTPLEEQLIPERFPAWSDRWLAGPPRPPRMHHGTPVLDPNKWPLATQHVA